MSALSAAHPDTFDVVICGGGLAGLTLARQLRREQPQLAVALVDALARPLPEAAHKVGESTVEVGAQYLEGLGLIDYLLTNHIVKFGLRFFPGGGELPIHQRLEIGPSQEPPLRSYQLDRGRFETDLRQMNERDGVRLFEGWRVRDIELSEAGAPHAVSVQRGEEQLELRARWVVDASGRRALLRRRFGLKRPNGHLASAAWFRVRGRLDVNELAPRTVEARHWHAHPLAQQRWRSTNHFMGEGYWVWWIPLASGNTSVGIVIHEERYRFDEVRMLERALAFIERREPHVARALAGKEILDFHCLFRYSHDTDCSWSEQRWALVGEAGAFVDPLYSSGTDFIGLANTFTCELIARDLAGEALGQHCQRMNERYRAFVLNTTELFRSAAPVYGHPRAMAAKVYFDNFGYWAFMAQYFQRRAYRWDERCHDAFTRCGTRFIECSGHVQALLRAWAEIAPEAPQPGFVPLPKFPSLAVDAYLDLQREWSPEAALERLRERMGQAEQMAAELLLRVVAELGPEQGRQLCERAGVATWQPPQDMTRLEAERLDGIQRRHALSPVVRDVERCLGRIRRHPQWRRAVDELLK